MTGSWKGRGNQYLHLVKGLYCKLPTNGKQLPAFPLEVRLGFEASFQRWEVCVTTAHGGPYSAFSVRSFNVLITSVLVRVLIVDHSCLSLYLMHFGISIFTIDATFSGSAAKPC